LHTSTVAHSSREFASWCALACVLAAALAVEGATVTAFAAMNAIVVASAGDAIDFNGAIL
jgi:putative intracellular protease/amidase